MVTESFERDSGEEACERTSDLRLLEYLLDLSFEDQMRTITMLFFS